MGMFDYVAFEGPCPKCGITIGTEPAVPAELDPVADIPNPAPHWQSKSRIDGKRPFMELLQPTDVRDFHTHCPGCGAWIEGAHTPMGIILVVTRP